MLSNPYAGTVDLTAGSLGMQVMELGLGEHGAIAANILAAYVAPAALPQAALHPHLEGEKGSI